MVREYPYGEVSRRRSSGPGRQIALALCRGLSLLQRVKETFGVAWGTAPNQLASPSSRCGHAQTDACHAVREGGGFTSSSPCCATATVGCSPPATCTVGYANFMPL